ncbi:MAG: UDP-N-acetylglucosamine--N-acetylmuramyl-(pentapeptide) pyrophosphoryl-undecaprenol N-acetylglucosamine transferase [Ruminococcaceae bacterium]|nr:UDP-N-acetylglucosamine--N-acetylmuramyl-(pentapeptide) pyrophosphoryl-undecaprenol N-acetylglucosamine transferase [Oscillospiraceae bacterium]
MRVLLTGGGTSGHVNPALAIADIIKKKDPNAVFAYVGTEKGIERRLVEKEGYPFYPIKIQGVSRSFSLSNIRTAYLVMTAPTKCKQIIKDFRPDVVIGTGGYVCWAPLKAAAEMGIPTIVHESNSVPGLAVKRLEGKIDLLLTNFKSTARGLSQPEKAVNVGNPIRFSFGDMTKQEARKKLGIPENIKFVILSFGGSLGAPKINEAAIDVMRKFSLSHEDVMHFHSGGKNCYSGAMQLFAGYGLEKNPRLDIREYIYDMSVYMAAADLIICRAGAMTITELSIMRKAAILIPSPHVTDNHQYKNAAILQKAGAAVLIEESELDCERINAEVERIYSNQEVRDKMCEAVSEFATVDVDERIYAEICKLLRNKAKIKRRG